MKVLVIGANYGLLVAGMFLQRNIEVDIFGTLEQKNILNEEGFSFSYRDKLWRFGQGRNFNAISSMPDTKYDLAVIATQEPSLGGENLGVVIRSLGESRVPFLSIMNIPLYQFLTHRLEIEPLNDLDRIYRGLANTNSISAETLVNSSPEPQVFSGAEFNQLSIRLGGVFRCSSLDPVKLELRRIMLESGVEGLPVSFREYTSPWVSLSKLPMLLAGNYRCIYKNELMSIGDAVHSDIDASREIYEAVVEVLRHHGASRAATVPFSAYLKASTALDAPSSVCRAIFNGRNQVERVDRLVLQLSYWCAGPLSVIAGVVANIDSAIERFAADGVVEN